VAGGGSSYCIAHGRARQHTRFSKGIGCDVLCIMAQWAISPERWLFKSIRHSQMRWLCVWFVCSSLRTDTEARLPRKKGEAEGEKRRGKEGGREGGRGRERERERGTNEELTWRVS
jgi:hypothetical protein